MSRDGSITIGDLVGKLEYLEVVCGKCDRRGHYRVSTRATELGPDAKMTDWGASLRKDCPRYQARNRSDTCAGGRFPDLVRLFGTESGRTPSEPRPRPPRRE